MECKQQNDVIPVWSGIEIEVENKLIDKNAQQLDAIRKSFEATIVKAAQIVARYGGQG